MVKKHPSKPLLMALTGNRSNILSSIHHGLADVSLKDFYPVLKLEEALAFAIGSYHDRIVNKNNNDYEKEIQDKSTYELFNQFLTNKAEPRIEGYRYRDNSPIFTPQGSITPYSWLRSHANFNQKNESQYEKMNSETESLEERLAKVDSQATEKLKHAICRMPNEYVFPGDYDRRKAQKGTNHGLVIMHFQPTFPKPSEQNAGEYASEIARILKNYPISLPQTQKVVPEVSLLDLYNKELATIPEDVREYAEQCGIDPMLARHYDLSGMPSEEIKSE